MVLKVHIRWNDFVNGTFCGTAEKYGSWVRNHLTSRNFPVRRHPGKNFLTAFAIQLPLSFQVRAPSPRGTKRRRSASLDRSSRAALMWINEAPDAFGSEWEELARGDHASATICTR
jgi:hypothetical protein